MKEIQLWKTSDLKIAPEIVTVQQELMKVDPGDRARLKTDIEKNGIRDPLKVYEGKNLDYYILAGVTRWEIAQEQGIEKIPIEIIDIPPRDRETFAISDNLNRRQLSRDQKQKLIDYLLEKNPKQSNKSIAKNTGTTKETVKDRRGKLESRGRISPPDKVTGADGKQYSKPAADRTPARINTEPALWQEAAARDYLARYVETMPGADRKKAINRLIQYLKTLQ